MRGNDRYEADDHLSQFEAEMDRLKKEREKAVDHADDLGYQVEVLRAKLHEARRALATRPAGYDNLCHQAEQLLRNAQIQADQMRTDAERELREARAQTQRLLQEQAEQQSRLESELHAEAVRRRQQLDQELAERRATVENHVNENVAWAEQLRARTESAGPPSHGGDQGRVRGRARRRPAPRPSGWPSSPASG